MARQLHTAVASPNPYGGVSATLTFTAADVANKEEVVLSDADQLIIWNTHATTAYNFVITSVDDAYGRTENISESIAAGVHKIVMLKNHGWMQTNGKLNFEADNTAIKFAVVRGVLKI